MKLVKLLVKFFSTTWKCAIETDGNIEFVVLVNVQSTLFNDTCAKIPLQLDEQIKYVSIRFRNSTCNLHLRNRFVPMAQFILCYVLEWQQKRWS